MRCSICWIIRHQRTKTCKSYLQFPVITFTEYLSQRNLLILADFVAKAQIPLGSTRHDTTRPDTFDVSSPCILAMSTLSNSTARLARYDDLDWLDWLDTTRATRNLVCCVISIKLYHRNSCIV